MSERKGDFYILFYILLNFFLISLNIFWTLGSVSWSNAAFSVRVFVRRGGPPPEGILVTPADTGCSLNIVFLFRRFKNIPDSGLSLFSLLASVCTHNRQVESLCCSKTGRVQKNHKTLRKKHNI